jgi:hypothetical protein
MDIAKQERFFELVRKMRIAQNEYYAYRDGNYDHKQRLLYKSKQIERQVDAVIIDEVKERKSLQANLF